MRKQKVEHVVGHAHRVVLTAAQWQPIGFHQEPMPRPAAPSFRVTGGCFLRTLGRARCRPQRNSGSSTRPPGLLHHLREPGLAGPRRARSGEAAAPAGASQVLASLVAHRRVRQADELSEWARAQVPGLRHAGQEMTSGSAPPRARQPRRALP
jgi:hypothetical protein